MTIRSFHCFRWLLVLAVGVLLTGCAHKPPEEKPAGTYLEDIYATANTNTELEMFRKAMPPYVDYLDNQILSTSDALALCKVAGVYYGYAYCFVEDTNPKEARILYLKGRAHAMTELTRYRLFNRAMADNVPIESFKKDLDDCFNVKNIQTLYWCAMNWAGWVNLNLDKPEAFSHIPRVEAMLELVNTLNDKYNFGSAHAMLGAMYANRPKADGGNPEKAKEEFDKAFQQSFNEIYTYHVMYAQYYATQIQDRELFRKTLATVIETKTNTYSDKAFLHELAKQKAKLLLDNMDKYFKAPEVKAEPEAKTVSETKVDPEAKASPETKNDSATRSGPEK